MFTCSVLIGISSLMEKKETQLTFIGSPTEFGSFVQLINRLISAIHFAAEKCTILSTNIVSLVCALDSCVHILLNIFTDGPLGGVRGIFPVYSRATDVRNLVFPSMITLCR